jgi:hypothetical protein
MFSSAHVVVRSSRHRLPARAVRLPRVCLRARSHTRFVRTNADSQSFDLMIYHSGARLSAFHQLEGSGFENARPIRSASSENLSSEVEDRLGRARSLPAHPSSRVSRGSCPYFRCHQITSRGSDLHPPAAPSGEGYALPREERAGTRRISRLLIERTITAICIGFCRFCNVIAPSRGRITWIQCRQVCTSSATDKEACNRNERARNQTASHQCTPCNHSIHVHDPLGNYVPDSVHSTGPTQ